MRRKITIWILMMILLVGFTSALGISPGKVIFDNTTREGYAEEEALISTLYEEDIILDYEDTNGIIKPFSEINCGPLPNHDINGVDLTNQYNQVGISFIRTHDFSGPTDISSIFLDSSADPYLESSYDFTASDKYISAIIM